MQKTYKLIIGSNNETGELEKSKILQVALEYSPEGLTYYEGFGVWKGDKVQCQEQCGILEIINTKEVVTALTKKLKTVLNQEAILVQDLGAVSAFV